jgi:hypothetical protein
MTFVYTRCLVCTKSLEANEQLQHVPHGPRLAFDPSRGRLWAVCRVCRRWSLMPIEDRWEAFEELEHITADKAQLLSRADNIALMRSGPLEIVRVDRAKLTEEAWLRYGRELASRKTKWDKLGIAAAGTVGGGWHLHAGHLADHGNGSETLRDGARWLRFGSDA